MPKLTFFNLPDDKKQILLKEAQKEFSRVPLYDASISSIIKAAGIPRGSFYQYFEDKEDLYFYLLEDFMKEKKAEFLGFLRENKGDIFDAFNQLFKIFLREEDNISFLQNALLNMTYKIERTFERMISAEEFNQKFLAFISIIDESKINVSNQKELYHAIQLLTTMTLRNLIQAFARDLPYEEAMENYRIEMNLLKNGLFK